MGAQASPVVETMDQVDVHQHPSAGDAVAHAAGVQIIPVKISHGLELLYMVPVLAVAALAAVITAVPLSQETLFGLLCAEVALIAVSLSVSVLRPRSH